MSGIRNLDQSVELISYPAPRGVLIVEVAQTLAVLGAFGPALALLHRAPSRVLAQEMIDPFDLVVAKVPWLTAHDLCRGTALAPAHETTCKRASHALVVIAQPEVSAPAR